MSQSNADSCHDSLPASTSMYRYVSPQFVGRNDLPSKRGPALDVILQRYHQGIWGEVRQPRIHSWGTIQERVSENNSGQIFLEQHIMSVVPRNIIPREPANIHDSTKMQIRNCNLIFGFHTSSAFDWRQITGPLWPVKKLNCLARALMLTLDDLGESSPRLNKPNREFICFGFRWQSGTRDFSESEIEGN